MNALDNVMDAAAAAAKDFVPPAIDDVENLPATREAYSPPAAAPSVQGMLDNTGIMVDEYVYPDKAGFKISKDMKGYLDDAEVIIDMSEVVPIISFSSELNGSSSFGKSYNGQTTPGGGNFQLECARLSRRPGSKNRGPFETVEIPMALAKAIKDPKSTLTFDEGCEVGLTPSPTGVKEFAKFLKGLAKTDPALTTTGRLKVKIVNKFRSNSKGNEWGVIAFELIEVLKD